MSVSPADRLITLPQEIPEYTLGWEVIRWAAKYLHHPNGPRAGKPWKFVESQVRFLLHWYAVDEDGNWLYHHAVRRLAKGSGKALALDTPLPTPSGWTTMGDVRVGDSLIDERGLPTRVVAATDVMHGRPCYRVVFRDGSSVIADADHLWPMDEAAGDGGRRRVLVTTREMADAGGRVARWRALPTPQLGGAEAGRPLPGSRERTVVAVEPVESVPVRCVSVDGPSSLYLAGDGMVPTHNSPFAALVALAELCAPVRLKDFDPKAPGGVVGKPVDMPLVQIAATAESQTANTMRMVRALAPKGSRIVNEFGLDPGKTRYYKLPEGTLEVITSSATAAEGAESTFVVADEALAVDTVLPAPEGWTTVGEVRVGDRLFGSSGPVTVTHVTPVFTGRPCYRVAFEDGTSLVADEGHLWLAKPADAGEPRVCTTRQMAEDGRRFQVPTMRAFAPSARWWKAVRSIEPVASVPVRCIEVDAGDHLFVAGDGWTLTHNTEHWKPSNSGPELAATLEDNLTKSGSRMLETCNAWVPGVGSVAEASWDAWVAQEEGRTRGESKILYDARIAPPDTNLADEESLRRALEFVYNDCFWQKIRPVMERIWDPRSRPDDSKRKYLNWPVAAEDAWVTPQAWSVLADPSQVVADGEEIVAFFDGSKSRDATALVGCRVSDGHVFAIGVWEPDPAHDTEDTVPVGEVDATVERMFDRWQVVGFFADVKEWEGFTQVTWPQRYADRLLVHAVPGGREPQPIAWDMRSHVVDFTRACELVETEIAERRFTHDGDSRVARHVANARRRPNRYGVSIGKESPDSPRKIDAAVCVIGARMVRRLLLTSPAWAQRKKKTRSGRVYGFG